MPPDEHEYSPKMGVTIIWILPYSISESKTKFSSKKNKKIQDFPFDRKRTGRGACEIAEKRDNYFIEKVCRTGEETALS